MAKRMTKEEFIRKAREKHGWKYDYSKVEYKNTTTKVCIICPTHGEFWQRPHDHSKKCGCPKCADERSAKLRSGTTEQFVQKAKEVHGDKYDYSKVEYKKNSEEVCIICPEHGEFWQRPDVHLKGIGCTPCGYRKNANKSRSTTEEFIKKAKLVHGDKYDYSKVEYVTNRTPITIICSIHGEFKQEPHTHLSGANCPFCSHKSVRHTLEEWIQFAREVHGNKYDYSKVEYKGGKHKVCIICPEHGEFWQNASNHIHGNGCPMCGGNKLSSEILLSYLLSEDLKNIGHHELLELIEIGQLPNKFGIFTKTEAGSKERQDDINALIEETESKIKNKENEDLDNEEDNTFDDVEMSEDDELDESESSEQKTPISDAELPEDAFTEKMKRLGRFVKTTGERVKYLTQIEVNKFWNYLLTNPSYINNIDDKFKDACDYTKLVVSQFKKEYEEVQAIPVDQDYKFSIDKGKTIQEPTLMQKLMVYRLLNNKYYGNWCGTGAGKTNSFLMASRLFGKITLCICPNSVVDTIEKSIEAIYPDSNIIIYKKQDDIQPIHDERHTYIIFNYEKFQLDDENRTFSSRDLVKKILETNKIDFICFDEAHRMKNSDATTTRMLKNLRAEAQIYNPDLRVLGMTATPLINSIDEVKTMLELISGEEFDALFEKRRKVKNSLVNIHTAHKYLTLHGFRFVPKHPVNCNEKLIDIMVDDQSLVDELVNYRNKDVNRIESLLVPYKMKEIIKYIKKGKTIIYTEFLKHLLPIIKEELVKNNISFAEYTGEQDSDERELAKERLKNNEVDVILASSPITTGVDGLQKICNTLILLSLPWTNAMYTQLIGRIYRQGSVYDDVDVIIPLVKIPRYNSDIPWSWDVRRWKIITTKKTISDAVVDGIFAEIFELNKEELLSRAIDELKKGRIQDCDTIRPVIVPDYSDESSSQEKKETIISHTLRKAHTCNSNTLYEYFTNNKVEWRKFHKRREEELEFDPQTVVADTLNKMSPRPQSVIDLGCGTNKLKTMLKYEPKQWVSVDYVSDDKTVIQADANDLKEFVGDESMDCAVFCLSLWGRDYLKALDEATRYLKKGGKICIVLPEIDLEENGEKKNDTVIMHMLNSGYRIIPNETKNMEGFSFQWYIKK